MRTGKIVKQAARLTLLCVLVAMTALLMGCGSSNSSGIHTTPKFLIAPEQTSGAHVNVFTVHADGTLAAVATSPQDMGVSTPETIVTDPKKNNIVFVADSTDGMIRSWSVDSAGNLTTVDTTAATSGFFWRRDSLAVSPDGKCLFAALGNTNVGAFQIGSDSKLTARTELDISSDDATARTSAVVASTGFVYIANQDDTHVLVATIGADCSLTLDPALTKDINLDAGALGSVSDLRSLAISPSGKHLMVADDDFGAMTTYTISSADGSLTNSQTAFQPSGNGETTCDLESVTFSTDGKFAYASDCDFDVAAVTFDDNAGTVTGNVPGSLFITGNGGGGTIVVDRSDNLVFTSGECGPIFSFKRDTTTGALSPATGNLTHTAGNNDEVCSVAVTY